MIYKIVVKLKSGVEYISKHLDDGEEEGSSIAKGLGDFENINTLRIPIIYDSVSCIAICKGEDIESIIIKEIKR